MTQKSLTLDH